MKTLSQGKHGLFGTMVALFALLFAAAWLVGQDQSQQQQSRQQDIPDAPSAVRPVQPFPTNLPPSRPQPDAEKPAAAAPNGAASNDNPPPPPMPAIKTVAPGSVPDDQLNTRAELYKIVTRVNFVLVPVTVKETGGHLVD